MIRLLFNTWWITQIVIIVLKATGNTEWTWVWVLSPSWVPIGALFALYVLGSIFYELPRLLWRNHKRKRELGF